MRRFTNTLAIGYVVCVFAVMMELLFKFQMGERDEGMWRYEWMIDGSWFLIFSLFLCAVTFLMRPHSRSRLLSHIEELRDSEAPTGGDPAAPST